MMEYQKEMLQDKMLMDALTKIVTEVEELQDFDILYDVLRSGIIETKDKKKGYAFQFHTNDGIYTISKVGEDITYQIGKNVFVENDVYKPTKFYEHNHDGIFKELLKRDIKKMYI